MNDLTELMQKGVSVLFGKSRETNTRLLTRTIFNISMGRDSSNTQRGEGEHVLFCSLVDFAITVHQLSLMLNKAGKEMHQSKLRFTKVHLNLTSDKSVDDFIRHAKEEMNFHSGVLVLNTLNSSIKPYKSYLHSNIYDNISKIKRNLLVLKTELRASIVLTLTGAKVEPPLADIVDTIVSVSKSGNRILKGTQQQAEIYKISKQ